jgi:hypothetical protein
MIDIDDDQKIDIAAATKPAHHGKLRDPARLVGVEHVGQAQAPFSITLGRTWHPGAAQWFGFSEDHASAERGRAFFPEHRPKGLNRRPCRGGGKIPAPRQMLTDCGQQRMIAGVLKARRFGGDHRRAALGIHIELVEKFAERRTEGRAQH